MVGRFKEKVMSIFKSNAIKLMRRANNVCGGKKESRKQKTEDNLIKDVRNRFRL